MKYHNFKKGQYLGTFPNYETATKSATNLVMTVADNALKEWEKEAIKKVTT